MSENETEAKGLTLELLSGYVLRDIFKNKNGKVMLYSPIHDVPVVCPDVKKLYDLVSKEIIGFYQTSSASKELESVTTSTLLDPVNALNDNMDLYISSGVVKEAAFNKTLYKVLKWTLEAYKHYRLTNQRYVKEEKRRSDKLLEALFTLFIENSRISKDGAYYCIAHILKNLTAEGGSVTQIFQRIKRRHYRRTK